jgi:hypothetical protein
VITEAIAVGDGRDVVFIPSTIFFRQSLKAQVAYDESKRLSYAAKICRMTKKSSPGRDFAAKVATPPVFDHLTA